MYIYIYLFKYLFIYFRITMLYKSHATTINTICNQINEFSLTLNSEELLHILNIDTN